MGSGASAYRAFVPHALPPKLAYTPELAHALSAADRALGELAGLATTPPNPGLIVRPFVHCEAVSSSRIEGTKADVADPYAYEASHLPLAGRKLAS